MPLVYRCKAKTNSYAYCLKRISVLTLALRANSFPVLNLFQTRGTITVLYQFITLTQFFFSIHEYFLICENSKCLI